MKYLEIDNLQFKREDFSMQISLGLERGKTGIILGPSGGGKTTLLRCISGLETIDSGRIWVDGVEFTHLPPEKRNFGFVFQDLALFDNRTGRSNIEYGLRLRGIDGYDVDKKVASLAHRLKIENLLDRKPWSMSGGEKQRLAFARAIAFSPSLLLLDEPLSSLDAPLRKELRQFLYDTLKSESITSLHVTHDVEEAFELGDIIHIVKDGRLIASGSPIELFSKPPTAWCANFLNLGSIFPIERFKMNGATVDILTSCLAIRCVCRVDSDSPIGNLEPYLFVPRNAVQIHYNSSQNAETDNFQAIVEGHVVRSHFLGEKKRIHVKIPCIDFSKILKTEQESNILTLDVDSYDTFAPGTQIKLSVDGRKCRILKP
jgi:ABC-type Fe3+/spermidine/putrescine transport system ATPase subunit